MNPLFKGLLAKKNMAYLILDDNLNILECADDTDRFADSGDDIASGEDVRLGFPELYGFEEDLAAVLEGERPSWLMQGLGRSTGDASMLYFDIYAAADEVEADTDEKRLVVILEDVTERLDMEQKLLQSANRANLLLQQLEEANHQLEEANQRLELLTIQDELTGIANRRHFNAVLEQEWRRSVRNGTPVSLILIDIDFFKDYNDTYGHQSGDACLKQVASSLDRTFNRPGDLVARYGGEEFVAVMSDVDTEDAATMAEKLRTQVEALDIPHECSQASTRVTISLGGATTIPAGSESPAALIEAADGALYQAKREGRNRVKHINVAQ